MDYVHEERDDNVEIEENVEVEDNYVEIEENVEVEDNNVEIEENVEVEDNNVENEVHVEQEVVVNDDDMPNNYCMLILFVITKKKY